MINKIYFLLFYFFTFNSFSQDTLFIYNELTDSKKVKPFFVDSIFIEIDKHCYPFLRDEKIMLSEEKVKFFLDLNKEDLYLNQNYLIKLQVKNYVYEVELPIDIILKGIGFKSNLVLKTYRSKNKIRFWKTKPIGYTFGTYIAISGRLSL